LLGLISKGSSKAIEAKAPTLKGFPFIKSFSKRSKHSKLSKSALKLLNEKEIIERISHPNILNCLEIIGKFKFSSFWIIQKHYSQEISIYKNKHLLKDDERESCYFLVFKYMKCNFLFSKRHLTFLKSHRKMTSSMIFECQSKSKSSLSSSTPASPLTKSFQWEGQTPASTSRNPSPGQVFIPSGVRPWLP
jgi:hypothetical protein